MDRDRDGGALMAIRPKNWSFSLSVANFWGGDPCGKAFKTQNGKGEWVRQQGAVWTQRDSSVERYYVPIYRVRPY